MRNRISRIGKIAAGQHLEDKLLHVGFTTFQEPVQPRKQTNIENKQICIRIVTIPSISGLLDGVRQLQTRYGSDAIGRVHLRLRKGGSRGRWRAHPEDAGLRCLLPRYKCREIWRLQDLWPPEKGSRTYGEPTFSRSARHFLEGLVHPASPQVLKPPPESQPIRESSEAPFAAAEVNPSVDARSHATTRARTCKRSHICSKTGLTATTWDWAHPWRIASGQGTCGSGQSLAIARNVFLASRDGGFRMHACLRIDRNSVYLQAQPPTPNVAGGPAPGRRAEAEPADADVGARGPPSKEQDHRPAGRCFASSAALLGPAWRAMSTGVTGSFVIVDNLPRYQRCRLNPF
jgi:hypothetical protein